MFYFEKVMRFTLKGSRQEDGDHTVTGSVAPPPNGTDATASPSHRRIEGLLARWNTLPPWLAGEAVRCSLQPCAAIAALLGRQHTPWLAVLAVGPPPLLLAFLHLLAVSSLTFSPCQMSEWRGSERRVSGT